MANTLHAALEEKVAQFPDRPWIHFNESQWTYAQGNAEADRIAAGLFRAGVRAGDRVALLFTNCPELVFCYYACFKIGAIAVPINTRFQTSELIYALDHAGAVALIGRSDLCSAILPQRDQLPFLRSIHVTGTPIDGTSPYSELARESDALPIPPATDGNALVVLLYTSGTTARPKGVMHSHATMLRQSANLVEAYGAATFAITVIALPLCHIIGFSSQMLVATGLGGSLWILSSFDAETALRTLQQSRATYFIGLPTSFNALVNHPGAEQYDLTSLILCICAGDCLPLELHARFKSLFGVDVAEGCGMTEVIYALQPRLGERRVGSIGKPIGDVRIRLKDAEGRDVVGTNEVGEIVIFSDAVTLGYWNDPESTSAAIRDGGMHSGDLARRDEDGYYWFMGRSKDIIIRGGSNISPGEVEDALYAHSAAYEAGVVGMPDPELGERVRAYVALKAGREATEAELIAWCGDRLAAYKTPESVVFADQLPKGPTGKVLRRSLRLRAAEAVG